MTRARKLGLSLLVSLVVLGITEAILRVTAREVGYATIPADQVRDHVSRGAMRYDPELGWTWSQVPQVALGINTQAFRYPELAQGREGVRFRGFTLGDSQTYGAGVNADQTYTAFAEKALREGEQGEIQLINAGISGYKSQQALRLIKLKLLAWKPDLVVIDCRTFDSPHDEMVTKMTGTLGQIESVLFYSRTYYLLRFGIEQLRQRSRPMRVEGMQIPPEQLRAEFGNHQAILDLGASQGFKVVFLDYPFWDGNSITCMAPASELPEGAIVSPVCGALQRSGQPGSALFLDNNHLTLAGNQIVGVTLAETLRSFLP